MRISDWSSDVCSSDLHDDDDDDGPSAMPHEKARTPRIPGGQSVKALLHKTEQAGRGAVRRFDEIGRAHVELQSLMRISYAVFCLKKKNQTKTHVTIDT